MTGHQVWVACSVVALALFSGLWIWNRRSPEHRAEMATYTKAQLASYTILVGIVVVPLYLALILVVLGLFPNGEPALYLMAVVLGLFLGALALLALVYMQRRPQAASGPTSSPAMGGSSA